MSSVKEVAWDTIDKLEQQLKALNFITTSLNYISKNQSFDESDFLGCEASIENIIDSIEIIKNNLHKACTSK